MSHENVEVVRRAVRASVAQPPDFATLHALYHLNTAWQERRQELDDVRDAGEDDVVVPVRPVARGREGGAVVEQPWAMVVTVRGGRLIASRTFLDRHRALKDVGPE